MCVWRTYIIYTYIIARVIYDIIIIATVELIIFLFFPPLERARACKYSRVLINSGSFPPPCLDVGVAALAPKVIVIFVVSFCFFAFVFVVRRKRTTDIATVVFEKYPK